MSIVPKEPILFLFVLRSVFLFYDIVQVTHRNPEENSASASSDERAPIYYMTHILLVRHALSNLNKKVSDNPKEFAANLQAACLELVMLCCRGSLVVQIFHEYTRLQPNHCLLHCM